MTLRMPVARILCPTDFSPGAQQAVNMGIQIAARTGADLVIAHVFHVPPIAFASPQLVLASAIHEAKEHAGRDLDGAVAEASAQLARPATATMRHGVPWAEIVALLAEQAFDLCVIGTQGRTGLARVVLGSVAEKVVRHAPCSVVVVRPENTMKAFQHVLVPTDFSTTAAYALELAESLVSPEGRITLLHMLEVAGPYPGELPEADAAALDHRATAALRELAASRRTVPIATVCRVGWPGVQILAALDEDRSIDLVAMGSRGRTGIMRALIGSVAEKTVRYAHCPVVVARASTR
jgi:nucleotide-binding universal stress UspA family protein